MKKIESESSFTLIELVIVIGILTVVAAAAILVINPGEFLKRARDTTRMSDLGTINKAIGLYQASGGSNLGQTNTVYISISSSQSNCSDLGLPSLPSGWSYACANSDNYRKVNGSGWVPVNLTSISFGSPLNILPIDPINTVSSANYYTYVTGGSWELTTLFESDKYSNISINDGDAYPGVYSLRTSTSPLTPGIRDKGLIGYWKFDEGSGTTANDSSGNGNTGAMLSGAVYPNPATTPTDFHISSGCKLGTCANFNGTSNCISVPNSNNLNFGVGSFSILLWFKTNSTSNEKDLIEKSSGNYGTSGTGYRIFLGTSDTINSRVKDANGNGLYGGTTNLNLLDGNWHYAGFIFSYTRGDYYVDGVNKTFSTQQNTLNSNINNSNALTIGRGSLDGSACSSERAMNGLVDDVRIYNRALSPAEIMAIYNATK